MLKGPQNLDQRVSLPKVCPRADLRKSPVIFLAAADAEDKLSIFGEFINHTLMPGQDNRGQWSRHNAFISDKFFTDAVICFRFVSYGQLPINLHNM